MKILRILLRAFTTSFHVRGRHRLANKLGNILAPNAEEQIDIDGIKLPIDHNIAMYRYIYYGVYEEEFVSLLRRIIKQGDVVIEPGANVGYITAILSSLVGENGKVFSLEPSNICYKKIVSYLTKPNIILMNYAIADIDGELNFIDKEIVISQGYSAFSEFAGKRETDNEYLIPTITVDTLIAKNNLKQIKLLKLDVEGAELMALKGASKALSNKQIDYILVETAFIDVYKSLNQEVHVILTKSGYDCYLMTTNGLKKFDFTKEEGSRHDVIWTCLKQYD